MNTTSDMWRIWQLRTTVMLSGLATELKYLEMVARVDRRISEFIR